ncbi:ABC transporter ATP-binding protein [Oscillospiraceae bacterium LTW-04]|nr:ABC transporter ATP-binding protein [Oscillospiraceae bacterium MB24-C1]
MLSLREVTYQYPKESAPTVEGLSFDMQKGEFVSLVGVSGCGKSTIFRLINGLIHAHAGEILVGGENVRGKRHYCGYMPQRDLLFPWRTVEANLKLPLEIVGGLTKQEMRQRADKMLEQVGLAGCGDKYPAELSGGMRQRAAFGRTVLTGSDLLLLDEPFSALDFLTRVSMQEWLLTQWAQQKKTILFITHDVDEAVFLSKRILVVAQTPIKTLIDIPVPLPYPRTRDMLARPEIIKLREQLVALLRKQVAL